MNYLARFTPQTLRVFQVGFAILVMSIMFWQASRLSLYDFMPGAVFAICILLYQFYTATLIMMIFVLGSAYLLHNNPFFIGLVVCAAMSLFWWKGLGTFGTLPEGWGLARFEDWDAWLEQGAADRNQSHGRV